MVTTDQLDRASDVMDALQGAFMCCDTRYKIPPYGVIGICPRCRTHWSFVLPGSKVLGSYLTRDEESGWSSWTSKFNISSNRLEPADM